MAVHERSSKDKLLNSLVNFIAFQLIWLACVMGAAYGTSLLGPLLLLLWMPLHFRWSARRTEDAGLAAVALALGTTLDTGYQLGGLLKFEGYTLMSPVAPLWISALWVNFMLTLNHSMRWIMNRPGLAALLGLLGGPLSYYAGVRLGAAQLLAEPFIVYIVIGMVWACVMYLLGRRFRARNA